MKYICDVCGPRLDWNDMLCSNCDVGIIYEINFKEARKPGRKPVSRARFKFRKAIISQLMLPLDVARSETVIGM